MVNALARPEIDALLRRGEELGCVNLSELEETVRTLELSDEEVGALVKGEAKDNPIFKLLFPAVTKVRRAEARLQARLALRKAAWSC